MKTIIKKCIICERKFEASELSPGRKRKMRGRNAVTCSKKCSKIYGRIYNYIKNRRELKK